MNPTCDPIAMPPLAVWETPPCPFRIEFPPAMLDEIGRSALDALYLVPRGGVEIGGVLFGKMENGCVRIETWRRIDCEYALGPSFTMSGKDRRGLTALLEQSGLEPVGWFHSHTRSDIELSPADVELYDSFFPGKRQIALVVRPVHLEPARAGFFFRDSQGRMETAASYREFTVNAASFLKMSAVRAPRPALASPQVASSQPVVSEPVHKGPMGLPPVTSILALLGGLIAAVSCFGGGYWLGATFR